MISLLLALIYLMFISLGLPDGVLGSVWPVMYQDFKVPLDYAGGIFMIISIGTVISSLFSYKVIKKLGVGRTTLFSILLTAFALFGYSLSTKFYQLIIFAIPYGFGAGSIDAALNNYVAKHFKGKHMNWLHSMWGIGALIGPTIMGLVLSMGFRWNKGYLVLALIQIAIAIASIYAVNKFVDDKPATSEDKNANKNDSLLSSFKIPGVVFILIIFFCYCSLEQTSILWGSTFLVKIRGIKENLAATFGSLFFIGITLGRIVSGFLSIKLKDRKMIRLGTFVILLGVLLLFLPFNITSLIGFALVGFGCGPIYPLMIHSVPYLFNKDDSAKIIGLCMASAYVGTSLMPPLFGRIGELISLNLLPVFLLILLLVVVVCHEVLRHLRDAECIR